MKTLTLVLNFEDVEEFNDFCLALDEAAGQNQMTREEFSKLVLGGALFEDDEDDPEIAALLEK